MANACFLDTNVLIYAAGAKVEDPRKCAIARGLIADGAFCLSAQVLAEFYVNAAKKYAAALTPDELDRWLELLSAFPIAPIDAEMVRDAVAVSRRHKITYWDAAVLVAAELLGAPILYTEDLNHNQAYGSVTVVNPFRES